MGGVLAGGAGLYVWRANRKVIEAFDSQTRQRSPIQSHIPLTLEIMFGKYCVPFGRDSLSAYFPK
jgi:hypothetical protein